MIKSISKKGQISSGLITGLIFGIASLIIGVIIAFVIVTTLTDADLLTGTRTTGTVTNETSAWLNGTGYQLVGLDSQYVPGTISISSVYNASDEVLILAANYSISSTGLLTNITTSTYDSVNITYTSSIYSAEEQSTAGLQTNFTDGVDNVSSKIPTVLLVAAIVLILGVLALLVATWQRMRIGGGSI